MQLQLPATSIFGKEEGENRPLQAYARYLAAQGVNPETVVTRLKFDTKSEAPKLHFKPMRWLSEDEYASAVEQGQSEDAKRAITMTVAQTDKVEPMKLEGIKPKAAAKPAPVAEEEEEEAPPPAPRRGRPLKAKAEPVEEVEETVEPTVRKEEKAAPAAPKSSLAKLAEAWDDE